MRCHIAEAVTAHLHAVGTGPGLGDGMRHYPRYSLSGGYVAVGPYRDAREREEHARVTSGSTDWLWADGDEMRFEKQSGLLTSAFLAVPEEPSQDDGEGAEWLSVPVRPGGLSVTPGTDFDRSRAESRWWDETAAALVCHYPERPTRPRQRVRLAVAPGLSLLWGNGRLSGWMLEDPARYLVHGWEPAADTPSTADTRALLSAYVSLLSPASIDAMHAGDPGALRRLEELRDAIAASGSSDVPRKDVLLHAVRELMEHWYDRGA